MEGARVVVEDAALLQFGAGIDLFGFDALANKNRVHEDEERDEFYYCREEVADQKQRQ